MASMKFERWMKGLGLSFSLTGSGHYKIEAPDKAVYAPSTGSDTARGHKNVVAKLRRSGVRIPRGQDAL